MNVRDKIVLAASGQFGADAQGLALGLAAELLGKVKVVDLSDKQVDAIVQLNHAMRAAQEPAKIPMGFPVPA